ncbi:MAG: hypothetical protein WCF93_00790 [Candidatus Moraniibacteriota bacterium]
MHQDTMTWISGSFFLWQSRDMGYYFLTLKNTNNYLACLLKDF